MPSTFLFDASSNVTSSVDYDRNSGNGLVFENLNQGEFIVLAGIRKQAIKSRGVKPILQLSGQQQLHGCKSARNSRLI